MYASANNPAPILLAMPVPSGSMAMTFANGLKQGLTWRRGAQECAMVYERHSAVEKRRSPGGRAQAISYLELLRKCKRCRRIDRAR